MATEQKDATKSYAFRVSESEFEAFETHCKANGISTADALRQFVRDQGSTPLQEDRPTEAETETILDQYSGQASKIVIQLNETICDLHDVVNKLKAPSVIQRTYRNCGFAKIGIEEFLRTKHPATLKKVEEMVKRLKELRRTDDGR